MRCGERPVFCQLNIIMLSGSTNVVLDLVSWAQQLSTRLNRSSSLELRRGRSDNGMSQSKALMVSVMSSSQCQ